ncbi:MAG: DUF2461 domain-containing protein [Actinomycetota bacterium]
MAYFTAETLDFWRGLAENNNKVWFDENRTAYETHLRTPYRALAEDLVAEIQDREPEYQIDAAKATYRINRDTRFAADKTPYKTDLGITVGRTAKHDPSYPAYTVRLGLSGIAVAGGMYAPDTALRDHLRRYVGHHHTALTKALGTKPYRKLFGGELQGEQAKRVPKDLAALAEDQPLVFNKQWVFWAGYEDPELLLTDDLGGFILDHWDAARPVNEFFKTAIAALDTEGRP